MSDPANQSRPREKGGAPGVETPPKPASETAHEGGGRLRVRRAAVRFAGDSGDGMQLAGTQFTNTSAVFGNDVSTLPDFPAEIRAPAGTLAGVSGFQINFSSDAIHTPGDRVDALIAMNPAALKRNLGDLLDGGVLIVNADEFSEKNLKRVGFDGNPLEGDDIKRYRLYEVPITKHTLEAVAESGIGNKEAGRCKNFYALGLVYWLYDRPLDTTVRWLETKFAKRPELADANIAAMKAGYHFGETAEIGDAAYRVEPAVLPPGTYRNITGNQALALGLVTAAKKAGKPLFYGSYPITPASDILQDLSKLRHFDVRTFQAEDEIAAVSSTVGAAFTGALAVTGSSGPGIALKQEAIGLAVMTELPMIIIDVQRGGPSTGLPTKTEQSDLFQSIMGRNGDSPVPLIAAQSPSDCFWTAIEAARIALKYMTPIFVLSENYLANGAEPWPIPNAGEIPSIEVHHAAANEADFQPYRRDENGARPWAIPGTPGLMHRIGGLEKQDVTGNVNYEPGNHERMTHLRAEKVANVANTIEPQTVLGDASGELLLVSWGGTYGAVRTAVEQARDRGADVSHMHLRWLNPMPSNVGEILAQFKQIVVCELNMGQLLLLIRGQFGVDARGYNRVQGRPFAVADILEQIEAALGVSVE